MGDDLLTALEITVVGMVLVFGAILVLWLTMALLVRLTAEHSEASESPTTDDSAAAAEQDEEALKRRAAAVAVAVALAHEARVQPHEFPLPPTAIVSPWQAVQRSRQLWQKGPRR